MEMFPPRNAIPPWKRYWEVVYQTDAELVKRKLIKIWSLGGRRVRRRGFGLPSGRQRWFNSHYLLMGGGYLRPTLKRHRWPPCSVLTKTKTQGVFVFCVY